MYLLTAGAEGQVAVPHLLLTFLASGLELDKADGGPVWESTWDELEEMSRWGDPSSPTGGTGSWSSWSNGTGGLAIASS